MRFKLLLELNNQAGSNLLPFNYQYELSAAIYKLLSLSDKEFSSWLHDNGYTIDSGKRFRLFSFSRLLLGQYRLRKDIQRIELLSPFVSWEISFLPENFTSAFVNGVFANQTIEIADSTSKVSFDIREITSIPEPEYREEMVYRTLSPICLKVKNDAGKIEYLSPTDSRAKSIILNGLISKYESFFKQPFPVSETDFNFFVIGLPKSTLTTIKAGKPQETKVKAFTCKFSLKAPIELHRIVCATGIGNECSQGFGNVDVINIQL